MLAMKWLNANVSSCLKVTIVMATVADADAAAGISQKLCYIFVLICYFFAFIAEARITYNRNTLIDFGKESVGNGLNAAGHEAISVDDIQPASQTESHRKQCNHPRKWEESRQQS